MKKLLLLFALGLFTLKGYSVYTIPSTNVKGFEFGLAAYAIGDSVYIINAKNEIILRTIVLYGNLNNVIFGDKGFCIVKDTKTTDYTNIYAFYNLNGNKIFEKRGKKAYSFSSGIAAIENTELIETNGIAANYKFIFNYYNTSGELVFTYTTMNKDNKPTYKNGFLILYTQDDEFVIVNKNGEKLGRFKSFLSEHKVSDGLIKILYYNEYKEMFYGFVDTLGNVVIPPKYRNEPGDFYNGRSLVCDNPISKNSYGFLDKTGKLILPTNYRTALPFNQGYSYVGVKNDYSKKYFIDPNGKIVNEWVHSYDLRPFDGGLYIYSPMIKYGISNFKGEDVLKPNYNRIYNYDPVSGLFMVKVNPGENIKFYNTNEELVFTCATRGEF